MSDVKKKKHANASVSWKLECQLAIGVADCVLSINVDSQNNFFDNFLHVCNIEPVGQI